MADFDCCASESVARKESGPEWREALVVRDRDGYYWLRQHRTHWATYRPSFRNNPQTTEELAALGPISVVIAARDANSHGGDRNVEAEQRAQAAEQNLRRVEAAHAWCEQDKHDDLARLEDELGNKITELETSVDSHRDALAVERERCAGVVRQRETALRDLRKAEAALAKARRVAAGDATAEVKPANRTAPDPIAEKEAAATSCYGVEDGLDGYCIHAPECKYAGKRWTGPNFDCIRRGDLW